MSQPAPWGRAKLRWSALPPKPLIAAGRAAAGVPARTRPDDPVVEEGVVAEGRGPEVCDASTFSHGHVAAERVSNEGVVRAPRLLAGLRLRPGRQADGHGPHIELTLESST